MSTDLASVKRRLDVLDRALEELEPEDEGPRAWYAPVDAATISPTTRRDVDDAIAAARRMLGLPPVEVAWFAPASPIGEAPWRRPGAFMEQANLVGFVEQAAPTIINLTSKLSGQGRAVVYEVVAHEAKHAYDTLAGRRWWGRTSRRLRELGATLAGWEARAVVEGDPLERRMLMPGVVVNGVMVDFGGPDEPTGRKALRERLREKVGQSATPAPPPLFRSLAAFVQGSVLAKGAEELGMVVDAWERAVDTGQLAGAEADIALSFLEAAHQRLERGTKATSPGPGKLPMETRAAGGLSGIEYGEPQRITTIR